MGSETGSFETSHVEEFEDNCVFICNLSLFMMYVKIVYVVICIMDQTENMIATNITTNVTKIKKTLSFELNKIKLIWVL